jgi:hypothetical protein
MFAATLIFMPSAGACGEIDAGNTRIRQLTEAMFLNMLELKEVYDDLHIFAMKSMEGQDRQRDYLQKSYLFIQEARLILYNQWRWFSILEYIKDSCLRDFFVLSEKELKRARSESDQSVRMLLLYVGYIEDEEAEKLIREGIGVVRANIYLYESLLEVIRKKH